MFKYGVNFVPEMEPVDQVAETSYEEHIVDALVPTGDEGRDKLR